MDSPAASPTAAVRLALAEDLGGEPCAVAADVTSRLAVPADRRGKARLFARARGRLAGIECAEVAFRQLDPAADVTLLRADGDALEPGTVVLQVECAMRALLAAERTALNFVQRLSGVATLTRAFVDAVAGTRAVILDTRKTTPGLRALEKRAVLAGGGQNHRFGLFDQVLLKENHFALARPLSYEEVVHRCVLGQDRPVVAEARNREEAVAAVRGGAAVVLLDNMPPTDLLRAAVAAVRSEAALVGRSVAVEVSGGITLANVRAYADCDVDRISIGALTHSAPALDLAFGVEGAK